MEMPPRRVFHSGRPSEALTSGSHGRGSLLLGTVSFQQENKVEIELHSSGNKVTRSGQGKQLLHLPQSVTGFELIASGSGQQPGKKNQKINLDVIHMPHKLLFLFVKKMVIKKSGIVFSGRWSGFVSFWASRQICLSFFQNTRHWKITGITTKLQNATRVLLWIGQQIDQDFQGGMVWYLSRRNRQIYRFFIQKYWMLEINGWTTKSSMNEFLHVSEIQSRFHVSWAKKASPSFSLLARAIRRGVGIQTWDRFLEARRRTTDPFTPDK